MGWKRDKYVKYRNDGFKGLFPGNMALVDVSMLAGLLIKYEEDFIICSKIEKVVFFFGDRSPGQPENAEKTI